jgi:D-alanyl-D-alanine carboxypeptidase (penicillin-binding protein 5/6)
MGAESGNERNKAAAALLDWGFANYGVYEHVPKALEPIRVMGGVKDSVGISYEPFAVVTEKGKEGKIQQKVELMDSVSAPVKAGDKVGEVTFTLDGKTIGKGDVCASEDVEKLGFFGLWWRILGKFLLK